VKARRWLLASESADCRSGIRSDGYEVIRQVEMAKNPEAERQSVAELTTLLLQERQRRTTNASYNKENNKHIRRTISHVLLWEHSEAEGEKYKGCRYWSEGAVQSLKKHGKVVTSRTLFGGDALLHEHRFPRKQLIDKLFSITKPTVSNVRTLLDKLNIAVIVTVDEHKELSKFEGDESGPWSRYDNAGILVRDNWDSNITQLKTPRRKQKR
jgi:hypothetical protein